VSDTIMVPGEDSLFPESSIAQLGVGKLEIRCQAFYGLTDVCFSHEITLTDDSKRPGNWGEEIFKGTLKDLVELIKSKKKQGGKK